MPHISFARGLVTGVSRELTHDEHWKLYYFEKHAAACHTCYNPQAVHQEGRALCPDGRELAVEVAATLFELRNGRLGIDENHEFVRVELPASYQQVSGLFKAIEASKKGILMRPRSMDKHFLVRPRVARPQMHHPVGHLAAAADYEPRYRSPRAAQYGFQAAPVGYAPLHHYSPRSSASQFAHRWSGESAPGRGSLFNDDQQVQYRRESRERLARYEQQPWFEQAATWG